MKDTNVLQNLEKLKDFDLNLLKNFEAVYICGSSIRAAEILGVTPSAVSQSLHKLRVFFDDPLFVREGKSMSPTSVANSIHENLSQSIGLLFEQLLIAEPAYLNQLTIYCSPFSALRVIPSLVAALKYAGITCGITHISSDAMVDSTEEILTYHKADLVFNSAPYYSFSTVTKVFDTDQAVAVCRKDHPRIKETIDLESMKNERSTFLLNSTDNVKNIQLHIENFFGKRDFGFSSSSIISIMAMTEHTDYISFVPKWSALKFMNSFNLKVVHCDFDLPEVPLYMTYHKNLMKNPELYKAIKNIQPSKIEILKQNSDE